jgi:hypothetical protein
MQKIYLILTAFFLLFSLCSCTSTLSYSQLSKYSQLTFYPTGITRSSPGISNPSVLIATEKSDLPEWAFKHLRYFREEGVDFNQYVVIIAQRGATENYGNLIIVTDIWQHQRIIYVRAQIISWPESAGLPKTTVYPADIVVVKKDGISGHGVFKIVLLDDYGKILSINKAKINE